MGLRAPDTARMRSTTILVEGLSFPEGPRWHDGELWFSDFYTHKVQSVREDGAVTDRATVPQRPSGLGFAPNGDLLAVSMLDRQVLRFPSPGSGRPGECFADLRAFAGGPCNDLLVNADGSAWVGNFGYNKNEGEAARPARLLHLDPTGRAREVGGPLTFPNGMVITPDGRHLIVAETFAFRLTMFDVEPGGELSRQRVFADLPGCEPDGIALDAEGAVWVADPMGKRVLRVFEGGRIADELPLGPERGAYACMLGGRDRKRLFILTNTGAGPKMADRRDGRIEYVDVSVAGAGRP